MTKTERDNLDRKMKQINNTRFDELRRKLGTVAFDKALARLGKPIETKNTPTGLHMDENSIFFLNESHHS